MKVKWPIKLLLVVMILGVFTPGAYADCRRVFFPTKKVIVHEPAVAVVEKKILLVAPEIPIYYPPAYGAQYVSPYSGQQSNETPAWAKELVDGFKVLKDSVLLMDSRLRFLEQRAGMQGLPPQPMLGATGGPSTLPATAPPNVSGYKLTQLTPENAGAVVQQVLEGKMPKNKPFSDADKIAFLKDLSSGDDAKVLSRVVTHCASCHDKSVAATKGKGLTLTEK